MQYFEPKLFEGLLLPQVNEETMDCHAKLMLQLGTWATQVEVSVAPTYFQVPVYYIALDQDLVIPCKWATAKPLCSKSTLCFPDENETAAPRKPVPVMN